MNIHHNLLLFTIASALLLLSPKTTALQAEPQGDDSEQKKMLQPCSYVFSIHDIDKSGSLSKEEYQYFVEQIESRRKSTGRPMRRYSPALSFEEIDRNNDGYISEDELITALNKRIHKHKRYRQRGGRW